ncbi:AI-2E family transporter [Propionivibrio sp.]|uniref:AI-2E family transporter n=1 Tax=Propionivibrio sp. TaxID=2212460 RepID=UPI0025CF4EA1|nr:AI-2E family transporter [Propionivibrio sp.]MBK8401067.1 AI-2E family transporter [Propionivibrio sp.]MBK8744234.1 AI-2E family transporter [Propionivibrio sp.]MBL0208844.1 AI-2E family transporter [Propionivibrio sp.]
MRRQRYRSGPLVWLAILFFTCLLLFLFQKILWLVVPFLLALIGYYLFFPLQQRLVLGGMTRATSAALVSGSAFAVAVGIILLSFPWISAHIVSWQDSASRYIEGGLHFIADTLAWAERNYAFAAKAHLSDQLTQNISELGDKFAGTYLTSAALTAAAWLPSLLLAPFLAFFFLRDGWRFKMFLSRAVPNAFFERTLYLLDQVDHTARLYFQGLIKLTLIDALCLAFGLSLIGVSAPYVLGLMTAVLAWVPYIGSILGCLLVVLVAATDFPTNPSMAYAAIGLFIWVRLLDDFFFMPMTIGRSLNLHPLLTVVMIFVGGAVAGVAGLMLVLPLLGIVMVLGETIGEIVTDPRLRARHEFARNLRHQQVTSDLKR